MTEILKAIGDLQPLTVTMLFLFLWRRWLACGIRPLRKRILRLERKKGGSIEAMPSPEVRHIQDRQDKIEKLLSLLKQQLDELRRQGTNGRPAGRKSPPTCVIPTVARNNERG